MSRATSPQVADLRGIFDLAFSRMVFEHVADGQRAWNNLYELLAPGGVALAFIPTLYSFPFVVNWLLPDDVAAKIVKLLYRNRTDDEDPVFPGALQLDLRQRAQDEADAQRDRIQRSSGAAVLRPRIF